MQTNDLTIPNMHEQLLQLLSAILIQLNALQALLDNMDSSPAPDLSTVQDGLKVAEQMTREAMSVVRTMEDEQQLPELEGVTLAEALSHIIEEAAEILGISSRVSFSGVDDQGRPKEHNISRTAERVLYLIAREALYEIQQHTGARRLRLTLSYGRDDVQMSIEDDGVPVGTQFIAPNEPVTDTAAPPFAAVLPTENTTNSERGTTPVINDLRSRIEHLGGSLEIGPQNERGTRVLARVPYEQHMHDTMPQPTTPGGTAFIASAVPAPDAPNVSGTPAIVAVRVLIVDNQAVTRAGLRRLLESYPGIHVVGEAADGVQAVSETLELGPQLVLMDTQLPNGQSMEALRQIKQLNLDTRVLLLATQDREEYLYETLRAGADGYVLKDIAPDELAQAVRAVARGEVLVQSQLAGKLLSRFGKQGRGSAPYESLTARELEVLRLLARGLRNKEIAARLYVSERTVNFHLANIYQKLNVSGRTEALSKALEQGLITA
jgi:DNA-binding NarL/FixJ family response regulator